MTQSYSKKKARKDNKKRVELEDKVRTLEHLLGDGDQDMIEEYEKVKEELK